jgi:hypothetical protein
MVDPRTVDWGCIDGRATEPLFATPGGDSGEFIAALSVYDRELFRQEGRHLTEQDVRQLLDDWLPSVSPTRRWFLHTDEDTMDRLKEVLGDPEFNIEAPVWSDTVTQDRLLELLVMPEFVGCSHLRLLLLQSTQYQVPVNITRGYLKAYYEFMWNQQHGPIFNHIIDFTELEGEHHEQAIVTLHRQIPSGNSSCRDLAPEVVPQDNVDSIFIFHEDTVSFGIGNSLAQFFAGKLNLQVEGVVGQLSALVQAHFALTTYYVGHRVPAYTATIKAAEVDNIDSPTDTNSNSTVPASSTLPASVKYVAFGCAMVVLVISGAIVVWHYKRRNALNDDQTRDYLPV